MSGYAYLAGAAGAALGSLPEMALARSGARSVSRYHHERIPETVRHLS